MNFTIFPFFNLVQSLYRRNIEIQYLLDFPLYFTDISAPTRYYFYGISHFNLIYRSQYWGINEIQCLSYFSMYVSEDVLVPRGETCVQEDYVVPRRTGAPKDYVVSRRQVYHRRRLYVSEDYVMPWRQIYISKDYVLLGRQNCVSEDCAVISHDLTLYLLLTTQYCGMLVYDFTVFSHYMN